MSNVTPRPQQPRAPAITDLPPVWLNPRLVRAVVLDADGVLTNSQPLRTAAWQDTRDAYLAQYTRVTGSPQYAPHARPDLPADLTGRLDEETAAGLLRAHDGPVDLAAEHLGPSGDDLLEVLVRHEDQRFVELLHSPGVQARPGAARLLLELRAAGIRTAAVSTGRHCEQLLRRAGLVHLVDACVDAEDALHYRLAGPPEPALYQLALKLLHTAPAHAALLVDTPLGAAAGTRARFSQVHVINHDTESTGTAVGGLESVRVDR